MQDWVAATRSALLAQDASLFAALDVRQVASIDSTNSELMRQGRAGNTAPQVLWAQAQTAGRGRMGRLWLGAPADTNGGTSEANASGLYFSVGLTLAPRDWSGLSLAVGEQGHLAYWTHDGLRSFLLAVTEGQVSNAAHDVAGAAVWPQGVALNA